MKTNPKTFAMIAITPLLLGIAFLSTAGAENPLKVTVSIVPQKYFVQKIGGDLVDTSVMVLPGASPATYEPKPQQMVALTKSKIYFAIGVPFEKVWLKKFSSLNSKMMIVHTEDGIKKIPMKGLHGHVDENNHQGIKDPHVWLSPPLVKILSRNILIALKKADPARRLTYEANYKTFMKELDDLDLKIRDVFMGRDAGVQFMVYHPSWGYFAKTYDLKQISIEIEGKEPTSKELKNLIQHAKEKGVKVIFVQPQFSPKSANTIAKAIGGQVVIVDPMDLNWMENLMKVAEKFKRALK